MAPQGRRGSRNPKLKLNIHLHQAQQEILAKDARFKIVACGRRFGKTLLDIATVLMFAAEHPHAVVWWVTPRYELGEEARKALEDAIAPPLRETNLSRRIVTLWNGTRIFYRSADRPDNLRAVGIDLLIMDEAAFVAAERWHRELRPTLADSIAPALLTSTFNGEGWFYDLFQMGLDPNFPEYASFRYPTSANPFIAREEIELARRTTPKGEFEQEWLANPLVYVGSVFDGEDVQRAVERGGAVVLREAEEEKAISRYAGLDWGYTNPTVLEVCEENMTTGEIDWIDERSWVAADLDERCNAIVEMAAHYGLEEIYADAAGATENARLFTLLEAAGLSGAMVVRVPFGSKNRLGETFKEAGIKTRRWYLETGLEAMSLTCGELIHSTKRYRYKEGTEDVEKVDDHAVDAATAFYASRRAQIVERGSLG